MKSIEKRLDEILRIRKDMNRLGLVVETVPNLKIVFDHMNDFVKEGVTWSGSVYLAEAERWIDVRLGHKQDCMIRLRVGSNKKQVLK